MRGEDLGEDRGQKQNVSLKVRGEMMNVCAKKQKT